MTSVIINYRTYIFILPVVLSWIALGQTQPKIIIVSALVMSLAEGLRQFLTASEERSYKTPKQLFFFGVVYKNSENFFLNKDNLPLTESPRARKFLVMAGVYLLSSCVRLLPVFATLDFIYVALFSLVTTLWIYCTSIRALSRLLFLHAISVASIFLSQPEISSGGFLIWIILFLLTQLHLQSWYVNERARSATEARSSWFSISKGVRSLALTLLFTLCYRTATLIVPNFSEDPISLSIDSQGANYKYTSKKQSTLITEANMQKLAKLKLQIDSSKISDIAKKDFDLNGIKIPDLRRPIADLPYGENQRSLEGLKEKLEEPSGNPSEADLENLKNFSKKIRMKEMQSGQNNENVISGTTSTSISARPSQTDDTDTQIEDRIKKLQSLKPFKDQNNKLSSSSSTDDTAEYLRSRKELASQVDNLIAVDKKNTLEKEKLNLQAYLENLFLKAKKFSIFLIISLFFLYWLLRKKLNPPTDEQAPEKISLPKEVRLRVKSLYKQLLSEKLQPREEVLKSYYILEFAFKEIEFPRREDLPPLNFWHKIDHEMPFIAGCSKAPIKLFNQVFYGEKNPDISQIKELRVSMHDLMKKLQVI